MALNLSRRAYAMPASPIRKLVPYAEAAVARGITVHHLNIGQPDVDSPQQFWDAIRAANRTYLEYSHSAGNADLRAKVARAYRELGLPVEDADVMTTVGGSEAVSIALTCIADQGDEVIVPEPMYANYLGFATAVGVEVVPLTTCIEENFALPPVEAFEAKITPRTRAIMICNPGNPTGTIYADEQLHALAELARRHNLFVIADEVYREFSYLGRRPTSILELPGLDDRAIMIDSVSKRFSLCGSRVGFLVSRNADFMSASLKMGQARLSPPTLEGIGVIGALDAGTEYFDAVRSEYRARRDLVVRLLEGVPGVVCPDIQGAFYATVRLPIDDCDRFCQWLLESYDRDGETVMLAPATGFYANEGFGVDEVRIAYVLNQQRLARAMDCLTCALDQYPGRTQSQGD